MLKSKLMSDCFLLLFVFCMIIARAPTRAQPARASYKIYSNTSCPTFESSSAFVVVTDLNDCLVLADASVTSNGALFFASNSTCILLTTLNNEIIVQLTSKIGWTTAVKDISNKFKLLLKSDSGQGSSSQNYNLYNILYNLSGAIFTSSWTNAVQSFVKDSSCGCTYRSPFIDNWNAGSAQVSLVRLRFWVSNRTVVEAVFNGANTDSIGWFNLSRAIRVVPYGVQSFITSPYCYGGLKIFVTGLSSGPAIAAVTACGACELDTGFFTSLFASMCSYTGTSMPSFIYSLTKTDVNFNDQTKVGFADFLTIEATITNRIIFV